MNIPGFTAEASLYNRGEYYETRTQISDTQQVVPQAPFRCMNKAIRLYDRCISIGHDSVSCAVAATDFWDFCNAYDL